MSTSGGGQGSPIPSSPSVEIPYNQTEELDTYLNCAVPLHRYAKIVGFDEPAMWGVVYENQSLGNCETLWDEGDRSRLASALAAAQQMLEQFIGYPLCPTWVTGTVQEELHHESRWVDQQGLSWRRMLTRYPRLIQAGIRASSVVAENTPITHTEKVGTVGPLAVSFTDTSEVRVYYPDSTRRIYPSKMTIISGQLTIEIPRYRMVVQDQLATPEGGIMYEDMAAYLSVVDVQRVYNDPSRQAILVRPGCQNNNCYGGCTECTRDACMYLRDPFIGAIDVRPATWDVDNLVWKPTSICGTGYCIARLYYQCGAEYLNLQAENAIVHLAHTLLSTAPCACDWLQQIWLHDKEYPSVMTREILNNPFGLGNGSWLAYCWAKSIASIRMTPFP